MDVERQILKHLPRDAQPTIGFIDEYCSGYKDLFKEVRGYECFKYLHLGMISSIKRKSLPEIAKVVGVNSAQSLASLYCSIALVSHRVETAKITLDIKGVNRK
jgi:hypothetical protein